MGVDDPEDLIDVFRQLLEAALAPPQGFLLPAAFDELPDLAADGGHHPQDLLVGLLDALAQELNDAEDFPPEQDGEGEGGVQAGRGSRVLAEEVLVLHHVRHPQRFAGRPDPARQPLAEGEGLLPAGRQEPGRVGRGGVPGLNQAQGFALRVRHPGRGPGPPHARANRFEDARDCRLQVGRLGQRLRRGVLGDQAALGQPRLVPHALFLQGVRHRLAEPTQPVFDDVVGRAAPHDLHRPLLADGARNDDEGDVQSALLHDLEGAQRVELRHGEVGKDDLGGRAQAVPEVLLGLHPLAGRVVAGPPQRVQHQLGVGGVVLEKQQAERCGSDRYVLCGRGRS